MFIIEQLKKLINKNGNPLQYIPFDYFIKIE
jgi:hypothetical protein